MNLIVMWYAELQHLPSHPLIAGNAGSIYPLIICSLIDSLSSRPLIVIVNNRLTF